MSYFTELCRAMEWLSLHPRTLFVGQGVGCAGTMLTDTLRCLPNEKLIEFPVAEELQTGFCTGLALEGWNPVCIFPRWNFVLRAADQIVNHLDRLPLYSDYKPKVIIRVAVPNTKNFDPGPQHDDDLTGAFWKMLRTIKIVPLDHEREIMPAYQQAMTGPHSTILVERTELYNAIPSGVKAHESLDHKA